MIQDDTGNLKKTQVMSARVVKAQVVKEIISDIFYFVIITLFYNLTGGNQKIKKDKILHIQKQQNYDKIRYYTRNY